MCESWCTNRGKLPADYLLSARVFLPKTSVARNWVIGNIRQIQFAIQERQLYAGCGARQNNFYLSNVLCICPSLFETYLNEANYIIYEKLLLGFSVAVFPFWGEIRPPTPVLLTVHFSVALKALVLGNLYIQGF